MRTPTPEELIKRLEAATEPDLKLDVVIHLVLFGVDATLSRASVPAYTQSLDAALTLVPEDWNWTLSWDDSLIHAMVFHFDSKQNEDIGFRNGPCILDSETTPAIALCLAAIRARYDLA